MKSTLRNLVIGIFSFVAILINLEGDALAMPRGDRGDRGNYGWNHCARENGYCNVSGPVQIRFGMNGRYTYMDSNGPVPCKWQVFGDPAVNVPGKVCEFRPVRPGGRWVFCATENTLCSFPGRHGLVRYGQNGPNGSGAVFTEPRHVRGGQIACTNYQFGDPMVNVPKVCLYLEQ